MTLMVCVDDKMGMAFNRRRQSRDRAVIEDMVRLAGGKPIAMAEKSRELFEGAGCAVEEGAAFRFIEFEAPSAYAERAETIVLYRWNRRYPADLRFDIDLSRYTLTETVEFPGHSHEKITREVYSP